LQERPVVLACEELLEAREELAHQLAFLFGRLRPGQAEGAGVVEITLVPVAHLL